MSCVNGLGLHGTSIAISTSGFPEGDTAMRRVSAAILFATTLMVGTLALPAPALAQHHISVGVGFGYGWGPGPWYGYGGPWGPWGPYWSYGWYGPWGP